MGLEGLPPELLALFGVVATKAEEAMAGLSPAQRDLLKAAGRIGAEHAVKYIQGRVERAREAPSPPPPPKAEAQRALDLKLLGVKEGASAAEIKGAYRKKARAQHPDKGGSTSKMQAINAAYERLSK